MQFSTIISRVETICNITSQRSLVKDSIQWSLHELTDFDLPYLMSEGVFTTVAPYETGTVDVTSGSATVSGNSTTFTAAMVGRKIRIGSDNAYYRIKAFVSVTEITLETVYGGTTASAATYSIYKDEYKLNADVHIYKVLRQIEDSRALGSISPTAFDILDPTPTGEGIPDFEIHVGTKLDTYSTGTVTASAQATTITGASTAFTSQNGISRGSKITIGNDVYTIKTIDSDTQLTIYEKISVAFTASSFSILLDNHIIQLADIPTTAQNIYYRYQRVVHPLINDADIPDLPDEYHDLLIIGSLRWLWQLKDKEQSKVQIQIFEARKENMWSKIGYVSQNRTYRRASQDALHSGRHLGPPRISNYSVPFEL